MPWQLGPFIWISERSGSVRQRTFLRRLCFLRSSLNQMMMPSTRANAKKTPLKAQLTGVPFSCSTPQKATVATPKPRSA